MSGTRNVVLFNRHISRLRGIRVHVDIGYIEYSARVHRLYRVPNLLLPDTSTTT